LQLLLQSTVGLLSAGEVAGREALADWVEILERREFWLLEAELPPPLPRCLRELMWLFVNLPGLWISCWTAEKSFCAVERLPYFVAVAGNGLQRDGARRGA
jgi:hypothetical protein